MSATMAMMATKFGGALAAPAPADQQLRRRGGAVPPARAVPTTFRRGAVRVAASAGGKTRFHRAIEKEGAVLMPGCYDALSAAIIQRSGFGAAFISGYAVSASMLGQPDVGLLTPPEMAERARYICAAAPLIPIIADADTGGGNALNVQRTIKDLIAAGVAGCFLEVIPAEEHATKIAAARDAIGDADFFLIARTDARATSIRTGLSDAIDRANLYMQAGADASFVEAPRDDDELREVARRTKGLRICNMIEGGVTPLHTPKEMMAMGFHVVESPLSGLYSSARALIDALKILREEGTLRDNLHKLATFEEFNQLIGLDRIYELEQRFGSYKVPVEAEAVAEVEPALV
ncbi:hypothetical protein Taro_025645 [Colocasia esculenta]|uniref:Carboxyphosphonoenolpyruvate phosphonomutase n=1 Tax=Colocasia esculenta TaxID=4460 RepID=A0A843VI56_COLES|nr:hypothetical protein [Colocasia esculenta]